MPTTTEIAGRSELMKDRSYADGAPPLEAEAIDRVQRIEGDLLSVLQWVEYFKVWDRREEIQEPPSEDYQDSAFLSRWGRKRVYVDREKFQLLFDRAGWSLREVLTIVGAYPTHSEDTRERYSRFFFGNERDWDNYKPIRVDILAAVITALEDYLQSDLGYKYCELLADFKNGRSILDL